MAINTQASYQTKADNECWKDFGMTSTLICYQWYSYFGKPLVPAAKAEHRNTFWHSCSTLRYRSNRKAGRHSPQVMYQTHSSVHMIGPNWKQPDHPTIVADSQMKYYIVIKMNKFQLKKTT
jgi:hypothetical protein